MALDEIRRFMGDAKTARSRSELGDALGRICGDLGFSFFALARHDVEFDDEQISPLTISTYPRAWRDQYQALRLAAQDPVRLASRTALTAFRWSDMATLIAWTREHKAHMAAARRSGIADGFSVPIHPPCGRQGSVSFAVAREIVLPDANLPLAELAGYHAYAAALRLADGEE